MLPTLDFVRITLCAGEALAVIASHDAAIARTKMWAHWRSIIARIAGVPPDALEVARTTWGKPLLLAPHGLSFNVSYGARCSLLALSRSGDIGCDVEDRLAAEDFRRIASVVLHPNEQSCIAASQDGQSQLFARCWVRKEAVLKAMGTGFGADPRKIDVRPAEQGVCLHEGGCWCLHDLADVGLAAAVATRDPSCMWLSTQAPS